MIYGNEIEYESPELIEYLNCERMIGDNGYFEDCSRNEYEISVLICTFNPDASSIIYTLRSALLQRNVSLQIVISDDGSALFDLKKIINFFVNNDYHDYVICRLKENAGTVKNIRNGLRYCKGKYVRGLGPGDYLYGQNILRQWIDFVNNKNVSVSFSNVICYEHKNDIISPVKRKANPQIISNYYRNKWEYNYLIFRDICVGAGILTTKDIIEKYTGLLEGKVIYAEDNSYRLMAYNHESMAFFNAPTVLYEVGNGVSTSGSATWDERLNKDWEATNKIMMDMPQNDQLLYTSLVKLMLAQKRNNTFLRKLKLLFVPGYLGFHLRTRLFRRYTQISIDSDYINVLLDDGLWRKCNASN